MSGPLVLGIETSCDETGVGIVRGTELLANVIASSMEEQARYGGVVPEVAARAHLEALRPTLDAALAEAGIGLHELDAIAVVDRARRRGLGRTLMLALLNEARGRGATEVFLEVRADNPGARALYESLGFAEIAVRPKYYQPDGVDAVIMRLALPEPEGALT